MAEQAGAAKLVGLTRKQAFKTSSFWLLFVAFALVGIGEQGPFQNFPSYMVQSGYGLEVAGNFMTFLAFAGCIGKLTAGLINDRIGPKWSYCLLNVLCALSLLAIMVAGSQSLVLLFACGFFFGAALSSSTICFSAATAMYLGPKHFGQIYGMVFLGKPIMDAVGVPLITAMAQGAGGWGAAFTLNYITLLADLPYIKGDTDAEEVVLLLNFTGKKVSHSNLLKINYCMSDSLLLYLNHTKFTQTC